MWAAENEYEWKDENKDECQEEGQDMPGNACSILPLPTMAGV